MKNIIIVILLFISNKIGYCQLIYQNTLGMNYSIGAQFISISDLNNKLMSSDLSKIPTAYPVLGVGLNYNLEHHFIEFSSSLFFTEKIKYNSKNIGTSCYGYGATIRYGYEFYLFDYLTLIPCIGISRDKLIVKINNKTFINDNFNDIIIERNNLNLTNNAFGLNLGTDLLIPINWANTYAGLCLMYTLPIKQDWKNDDISVINAPKINSGGFKIGLNIIIYMRE